MYRRYVDGLAYIASYMSTLTRKSVKFELLEVCERSFQVLKDRLTSTQVLILTRGTKDYEVYFDASRVGLGCVLM